MNEEHAVPLRPDRDEDHEEPYLGPWWGFPPLRRALVGGVILAAGYLFERTGMIGPLPAVGAYVVAAVLSASHWGREAIEALEERRVNIDVLMAVATVGSAVLGLWEEAAFLAFLYGAAEGLEEYTYDRTRGSIRSLLDLAPKEAHLLRDGEETTVPAAALVPGDRFLVRPGESLPTDGVVRSGSTSLNEAVVTGESVPVDKTVGDQVFAGTINLTGAIEVEATTTYADNTLSRIIHLVEEAQERKTRAQQLIDRLGAVYSPAVLAGAVALAVVPPLLLGGDLSVWARRAVTLAVAGAPCALVMSTPVAVAAAIGSMGRRGVLVKGGVHLENLARVQVVCFDKTGTLTTGRPTVTDILPADGHRAEDVLYLAAAVEAFSEHPLARAIVARAERDGVEVARAEAFHALTGAGARARVDGNTVTVGKPELFGGVGDGVDAFAADVRRLQTEGKTVVLVGTDDGPAGLLALRDEPREGAAGAVAALHDIGIRHVAMLTGDNRATAEAVAAQLGVDEVLAELTPEDKTAAVADLEERYGPVAMVGDGINDAPALATATVGIAMGAAGTDAAIEAADVALLGEDLQVIAVTVASGRRVRRISLQNVVFSIALLAVLVPGAVAGAVGIATAVTAHEAAEIIAVLNGLRARRTGDTRRPSAPMARAHVPPA